jgi:hypothetical protein
MKVDTPGSDPNSATTSKTERRSDSELSEADYLARESELTKLALTRTLEDLKSSLRSTADLRLWTRKHPWAALGIAAAAGFSAAAVVASKRSESEQPERRERPDQAGVFPTGGVDDRQSKPLMSTLFSSLFDLAKVALQSSIAAAAVQPQRQDAQPEPATSQSVAES